MTVTEADRTQTMSAKSTRSAKFDRRHQGRRDDDLDGAIQISVARALVDLERAIDPSLALDEMLTQLTRTIQMLMSASVCIAVLDEENSLTLATATDEKIKVLGEMQLSQQEGPFWSAHSENDSFEQLDVSLCATRWSTIMPIASVLGFRYLTAIPIWGDDHSVGVVCLAREHPSCGDHRDTLLKLLIAGAGIALASRRSFATAVTLTRQLQSALNSRIVMEQAKGFICAQTGCSPDQAFDLVRGYARNNNRKLNEVTKEVIERKIPIQAFVRPATPQRSALLSS